LESCTCVLQQSTGDLINVRLSNKATTGGQVVFRAAKDVAPDDEISLTLNGEASATEFYVSGKFGAPSLKDNDVVIILSDIASNSVLLEKSLMVRVRMNANRLTDNERNRFLKAVWQMNLSGQYELFCDIHNDEGYREAQGRFGFLPWHRTFLLDFPVRPSFKQDLGN
jgi:tyrosinase